MPQTNDREKVRLQYRPETVSVLFVGESPPVSGRFFYFGSGIVFSSTQRAFSNAWTCSFETPDRFLRSFADAGCFLEDLSHSPVDGLPPHERERALEECVKSFAQRLRSISPKFVVVFLKKIAPLVERAAALAGFPHEQIHVLPFPGNGHQNKYVSALTALLLDAQSRGLVLRHQGTESNPTIERDARKSGARPSL